MPFLLYSVKALALGNANAKSKGWHFKPQTLLHQGIVNNSIAIFFAILLQYNSKLRIVL